MLPLELAPGVVGAACRWCLRVTLGMSSCFLVVVQPVDADVCWDVGYRERLVQLVYNV